MQFTLREITVMDIDALQAFEKTNRAWFELWVPPRPKWFFDDTQKFAQHMHTLVAEQTQGLCSLNVIVDAHDTILGRMNLTQVKDAPQNTGEVGYRIGQQYCGNGLASRALTTLCINAVKGGYRHLFAYAAPTNPASTKVLKSAGFTHQASAPIETTLNNAPIRLARFEKALTC